MIDGLDNNSAMWNDGGAPVGGRDCEMRVETSDSRLNSADHGRIINVITKSGTNEFHGSAFEFYRHEKFDARNTFSVGDKPRYRQNQFGGVFGGPIIKGKTFFFGDYAGLRQKQGMTFVSSVPTAKMRAGDFSEVSAAIYDPFRLPLPATSSRRTGSTPPLRRSSPCIRCRRRARCRTTSRTAPIGRRMKTASTSASTTGSTTRTTRSSATRPTTRAPIFPTACPR
jgi:hypothetical protein